MLVAESGQARPERLGLEARCDRLSQVLMVVEKKEEEKEEGKTDGKEAGKDAGKDASKEDDKT